MAHRGASAERYENTLPAFELAIEHGADAIELDVRATRDGAAIALHDSTLDRTTDGTGRVRELTLAHVRALDAGAGAAVPTVAEVLDLARGRVKVMLEIKDAAALAPALRCVERGNVEHDVAVMAFSSSVLREARRRCPAVSRVRLSSNRVETAIRLRRPGEPALGAWHRMVDRDLVRRCHDRGRALLAWTADDERELRRLVGCGVDAVVTNRPNLLSRVLSGADPGH